MVEWKRTTSEAKLEVIEEEVELAEKLELVDTEGDPPLLN